MLININIIELDIYSTSDVLLDEPYVDFIEKYAFFGWENNLFGKSNYN